MPPSTFRWLPIDVSGLIYNCTKPGFTAESIGDAHLVSTPTPEVIVALVSCWYVEMNHRNDLFCTKTMCRYFSSLHWRIKSMLPKICGLSRYLYRR